MSASASTVRFLTVRREGVPTDVGLFWEPDPELLAKRLRDTEADRETWIERYSAMDALHHTLARERDALLAECEGLRRAVVQAREQRAREQHRLAEERAANDVARATVTIERDRLLAQYAALDQHAAEIEADRGLVEQHRNALASDREIQIAARAAAEAALAAPRGARRARHVLGKLRRAASRIFGS